MPNQKFSHKNYTVNASCYQLFLPLNIEVIIPEDDSVRLLVQIVEEMDLTKLYQSYSRFGKHQASPKQLLKIMLYAYMNRLYSSRDIEKACRRDVNFMYLLEGRRPPDHTTIARFRKKHIAPIASDLHTQINRILLDTGELSQENLFIDGTKIEAAANKYTFVWKKAVIKNREKLKDKLPEFAEQLHKEFGIDIDTGDSGIHLRHLKTLRKVLKREQQERGIRFVHGTGRKKPSLQSAVERTEEYISRMKRYDKYMHIAGSRNSFSKTDPDATFMRMKEDAMHNGQLKPAYNVQFGVDSEYLVWVSLGAQPCDSTALIPFLNDIREHCPFLCYENIIADAGYESEENYLYLKHNGYAAYIKPQNYEQSKKRSYSKDIGRRENMKYDEAKDIYICSAGRELLNTGVRLSRTAAGYTVEKTRYSCRDCSGCLYKKKCIRGHGSKLPIEDRNKNFEISRTFLIEREKSQKRITSEKGKQLRINRSIQSEGAFGDIKEDMSFRRFLCRGSSNVHAETILLALAHNVNKLHNKIQNDRCGEYLHPLPRAA